MTEEIAAINTPLATGRIDLVRALVQNRQSLRTGFARIWTLITRLDDRVINAWAAATLELSDVHAGPAGIEAFWTACATVPPHQLADVLRGGSHAAEICRLAGSRAATASLVVLPVALRRCGTGPESVVGWWRGLTLLAREAPALVAPTLDLVDKLLPDNDGETFADFVAAGLKATARNKAARAAFFALESPLARSLLERRRAAGGFADVERLLNHFVTGLWGGTPRLQASPLADVAQVRRPTIAEGIVLLPPVYPGVPAQRVRDLYCAAAAHAHAHLAVATVRQPMLQLKPLQIALIGLIEDARVETLAIRRFPGLRRRWSGFHVAMPGGANTCVNLMARLGRALLDPGYVDNNGFVQKGLALFAAEAENLYDPGLSRRIGGLLGNDLGQLRVQFNAKTYVVEPAYRCDNLHLWECPDAPESSMALTVDAARGHSEADGDGPPKDDPEAAPRARSVGREDGAAVVARYPEWDSVAGVERPDWTTLRNTVPRLADSGTPADPALYARVARSVRSTLVGRSVRQPPQEDGEHLDLDAAIDLAVARRGGNWLDSRVYYDRRPTGRDLSTLIILDVSQSTSATGPSGQSVLAAQVMAVGALIEALEERGDHYAVRAFASAGRDDIRLSRLKDFGEKMSPAVAQRLAGLRSGLSTRLGAALRHVGAELAPLRTTRKLALVLTDGEPSDIDVVDPRELAEDARRAALGLRSQGIDVFGIVMDPTGVGSASTIFGRHNVMAIRRLEELPARLADLYFRLSQR